VYRLRPGLLGVRVLVAYRGQFSGVTVVSHAVGSLQPVKVDKVIRSERGKDLLVIDTKKFLLKIWNDDDVLIKNVNATQSALKVERFSRGM